MEELLPSSEMLKSEIRITAGYYPARSSTSRTPSGTSWQPAMQAIVDPNRNGFAW